MSPAFISLGPSDFIKIFEDSTSLSFKASCLMFKIISVTSSIIPGIEVNSCVTPVI